MIKSGGQTLYQSTQEYRVITQANPVNLTVMVRRPMTVAPVPAPSLDGTAWRYAVQGSTLFITYSGSDTPLRFVRAEQ